MKDGFAQVLTVFQNGNETTCKRIEKLAFPNLNLEDFTGDFYSEELDTSYLLFLEDGKLKVQAANYDPQELVIYSIDAFTSDGNLLRFNRSNGLISGFELDAGRVTNLKFQKK